jgi:probable selenium-dependent hydroxylase accessory protein YqeC
VIGLGRLQASGKLADPSAVIPFEALLDMADYVVVEADGAAGRPLKAHRPWEPVVPACSTMTVGVVGASGMGRPAALACHCPERFCALARLGIDEPVGPEHVAVVLNQEALADCWLVNQLDALADQEQARRLCDLIEVDAFPCSLGR